MKDLLIYFESAGKTSDPTAVGDHEAIAAVASLVEAVTAPDAGPAAFETQIHVVASPIICLELGLSILGRQPERAIERQTESPSPLHLIPCGPSGRWSESEWALLRSSVATDSDSDSDSEEGGLLSDLVSFGVLDAVRHPWLRSEGILPASSPVDLLERLIREVPQGQVLLMDPPSQEVEKVLFRHGKMALKWPEIAAEVEIEAHAALGERRDEPKAAGDLRAREMAGRFEAMRWVKLLQVIQSH